MKKILLAIAIIKVSIGFSQTGNACGFKSGNEGWSKIGTGKVISKVSGGITFQGKCSFDGASGTIKKMGLNGDGNTYVRFYIFVDDASGAVFKSGALKLELANNQLKIGGKSTALVPRKWHQVQLQIKSGATKVWIDNDLRISDANGLAKVTEIVFGGANGKVFIDAIAVSNGKVIANSSLSGKAKTLIPGDANGDGNITVLDVISVREEIKRSGTSNPAPSIGIPDCNLDGKVRAFDIVCIRSKI